MFKRRTLFILGAGSSAEVGLPVGTQLADTIAKKLDVRYDHLRPIGEGDLTLFESVKMPFVRSGPDPSKVQFAGWRIRDGIRLAQSIDDFLDLHRNDKVMTIYGKAAIVKSILEAERNSKLFFNPHVGTAARKAFDPAIITDTWFVKFMRMLGRGIPKESATELFNRVSFINFNYDRCVEHFLSNAVQALYSLEGHQLQPIIAGLRVIHPYGSIGKEVAFGSTRADYLGEAERIKTYTEQIGDDGVIDEVRAEVQSAECIVFLGFAYHSQNLSMLMSPQSMKHKFIYGTRTGCPIQMSMW